MEPKDFVCSFQARWADTDMNGHLRAGEYSDYAVETRLRYLAEHGFSIPLFQKQLFGPVILREDTRYYKEIIAEELFQVSMLSAGLSSDGSQWAIVHEFTRADGKTAATLRAEGGWINLRERRLFIPPKPLIDMLANLRHSDDYTDLPGFFG